MSSRQALDQVLETLRDPMYIGEYLTSFGYNVAKRFRCPNPDHPDQDPSAGLIRQGNRGYCFSCHTSFDLFDLCVWLEGRPSSGPGWITETVKYLADRFSIPFEAPDLTQAELREMEVISAYSHAYQIIRHVKDAELPETVAAKLAELRWDQGLRYKMGIGTVQSYEDFIHRMTVQYKHSIELLRSCDLAVDPNKDHPNYTPKHLFNPDSLIFTIRDENGVPVGFSARNLKYEEQKKQYDAGDLTRAPKKYVHTRGEGTLFHKSSLLFNLDLAKKATGPVEVVEGNPDTVTFVSGGNQSVVGILGTAFTREHLELLISLGKKHIIVAMDADKAGKAGIERTVNLVKEASGHIGLQLEVRMLSGVKDPDQYIRSFASNSEGLEAYRKLPTLDLFSWSVKDRLDKGEDPYTICDDTIPLIVNEQSFTVRMKQARQLADLTKTSAAFVEKEVLRLLSKEDARLDEERQLISDNLIKKLRQDPDRMESLLSAATGQIEALTKRKAGYNPDSVLKTVDLLFEQKEAHTGKFELLTGYPIYDRTFEGLPRSGAFILMPGKPHHGKSNLMDNLTLGLAANNDDVRIVLHSIDDSLNDRINRVLGAYSGMPSKVFRTPTYYLNDPVGQMEAPANFAERYQQSKNWMREQIINERLIIIDTSILPPQIEALKAYAGDLRRKYPEDAILVFGDNFHLYNMNTDATGEEKISAMSSYVTSEIISLLRTSVIMTVEIPKGGLAPGMKPNINDIKGSGRMSFDAKASNGVYNQLQDWVSKPEMVDVWWESPEFMETVTNSDGVQIRRPIRKPIIEVIIDKNKINGESRSIFFRLENKSGRMTECSEMEQEEFALKIAAATEARESERQAQKTERGNRRVNSNAPYRARM